MLCGQTLYHGGLQVSDNIGRIPFYARSRFEISLAVPFVEDIDDLIFGQYRRPAHSGVEDCRHDVCAQLLRVFVFCQPEHLHHAVLGVDDASSAATEHAAEGGSARPV